MTYDTQLDLAVIIYFIGPQPAKLCGYDIPYFGRLRFAVVTCWYSLERPIWRL